MQPRRHGQGEDEAESEAGLLPPVEPDGEPDPTGYDDIETEAETPTGGPSDPGGQAGFDGQSGDGEPGHGETPGRARNAAVKLAQLGEPLAVEVILYVDGQPASIPVTMLIAEGAIGGVEVAAPGFSNVLVVGHELAEELRLWL